VTRSLTSLLRRVTESLQSPELRQKLEDCGPVIPSPKVDLPKFLASETAKYPQIVDFSKIKEKV